MKPIVITCEAISGIKSEVETISKLISDFRCRVHIRKKNCSSLDLDFFCNELSNVCDVRYLTLHGSPELVEKYAFGGYHAPIKENFGRHVLYSKSCHSIIEVNNAACDYLFLSPIFDSISKPGYPAAFDLSELKKHLHERRSEAKIIALGGINSTNVSEAKRMGFDGVAVLGSVWKNNDTIENYKKILENI